MGVKGLWRLLLPIGRRVSMETLHGKVLAIDASIWLTQFLKAMRDAETGRVTAAAHLIGFFRRLCRLTFHGIRPVFVFDGATPEIKQRELAQRRKRRTQFATLGDASVQRLARRLLAETLKQQKAVATAAAASSQNPSSNSGNPHAAYAPGFNPGGESTNGDDENEPDAESQSEKGGKRSSTDEAAPNKESSSKQQPVVDLLEEMSLPGEDENDAAAAPDDQVNDWDNPIAVDGGSSSDEKAAAADDDKDDGSSSDGSVQYEDFGLGAQDNNNNDEEDNHRVSVERISSLPAEKRKDAIEDAKRRLRLQSRKEFMPAAADPLQFSQVQVANFLKSSRLNKSIVQMATQAAKKDNQGLRGEAMASDRTTRVELIRENDTTTTTTTTTDSPAANTTTNLLQAGPKGRKTNYLDRSWKRSSVTKGGLLRHGDDENSSDEECWEDTVSSPPTPKDNVNVDSDDDDDDLDRKPAARPSMPPVRRRRRVFAVDESSSDDDDDDDDSSSRRKSSKQQPSPRQHRRVFAIDDSSSSSSSSSDDEEGGGFFPASSSGKPSKQQQQQQQPKPVAAPLEIEILDSSDSDEEFDGDEGGGFLPQGNLPQHHRGRGTTIGNSVARAKSSALGRPETTIDLTVTPSPAAATAAGTSKSDATIAQELADRALAEALQQAEDADATAAANQEESLVSDEHHHRRDVALGASAASPTTMQKHNIGSVIDDYSSRRQQQQQQDSRQWPSAASNSARKTFGVARLDHKSGEVVGRDGEDDDVDWEDGELDDDDGANDADAKSNDKLKATGVPATFRNGEVVGSDDEDEDDNVDWEDGEVDDDKDDADAKGNDKLKATGRRSKFQKREVVRGDDEDDDVDWEDGQLDDDKDDADAKGDNKLKATSGPAKFQNGEVVGSDDEDDDVDWEDGELDGDEDDADAKGDNQLKATGGPAKFRNDEVGDVKENKAAAGTEKGGANGTDKPVSMAGQEDNEDDIWGGDGGRQPFGSLKRASSLSTTEPSMNGESPEDGDDSAMWDSYARPDERRKDAGPRNNEPYNAETTAALERAQATASNLANWAGRVFKRAMKEAVDNQNTDKEHISRVGSKDEASDGRADVNRVEDATTSPPPPTARQDTPSKGANETLDASLLESNNDSQTEGTEGESSGTNAGVLPDGSTLLDLDEGQWQADRNRRERDMDTVTDEMRDEAIRLLQLFGVPFVKAPSEAEAQCAALEALGLVDGIVTDDSDVFVFGGKTVYKNIFDEMKYVEVYLASDAEKEMSLGRNQMIALAMLLGGDYTEGVKGVGIVNGMEILETFDVSNDLKQGLGQFKKWLDGFDPAAELGATTSEPAPATKEELFHSKHRTARTRWVAPDSFPSERVIKAYLNPVVDKSETPFSWGSPDVDGLVAFCERNIGWPREETMRFLDPVVSNAKTGYRQTRIDSYMKYDDGIKFADVKSKRLRDVLGLTGDEKDSGAGTKRQRRKS